MRKLVIILMALALLGGCSQHKWTKKDIAMEATWQAVHAIDYAQTRYIAAHPDEYYEMNPLLGEHPSEQEVIAWFAAGAVVHALVTDYLPPKYRPAWQVITFGISAGCVGNNFNMGIGLKW